MDSDMQRKFASKFASKQRSLYVTETSCQKINQKNRQLVHVALTCRHTLICEMSFTYSTVLSLILSNSFSKILLVQAVTTRRLVQL